MRVKSFNRYSSLDMPNEAFVALITGTRLLDCRSSQNSLELTNLGGSYLAFNEDPEHYVEGLAEVIG